METEIFHYFTSLKELQSKYPTAESLQDMDAGHIDAEAQKCKENI